MIEIAVIIPAAGRSKRFQTPGDKPASKLDAKISRKAVLVRAVELFARRPQVKQIIVAADPDNLESFKFRWAETFGVYGVKVVAGGRKERWETVLNALESVEEGITHVAVHDAARPVTDVAMIDRVFEAAMEHDAVIPALPLRETLKRVEQAGPPKSDDPLDAILDGAGKKTLAGHRVVETLSRDGLWTVQTPQVFKIELLRRAYEQIPSGKADPSSVTDDAMLVESLGESVMVVDGDTLNIKITTPEDVSFAEAVASIREGKPAGGDPFGPKRKHKTWAQMDEDV